MLWARDSHMVETQRILSRMGLPTRELPTIPWLLLLKSKGLPGRTGENLVTGTRDNFEFMKMFMNMIMPMLDLKAQSLFDSTHTVSLRLLEHSRFSARMH